MSKQAQTVVIGAGPGGYTAAFKAADLGRSVILVDPLQNPGGVCLHWGCIPSKALLHLVKVMDEAREAKNWGVTYAEPKIDLHGIRAFKDKVVKQLTGGTAQLAKQRKVEHVHGHARFTGRNELTVALNDGGEEHITFEDAIIATGATPISLPNVDIESERILYAKTALDLEEIPESLLVVGGGYIGLELGSVFSKLGSEVTVVEMTPGLMPGADRDLVEVFEKQNKDVFAEIHVNTIVDTLEEVPDGIKAVLKSTEAGEGADKTQTYSKVLLTVGHRPNTRDLGLDTVGVETTDRGFVTVDDQRRTSVPHIYAIGDVAGAPLLAHKAMLEGKVAAEVIAGHKSAYDPATIPAVEYTEPEIAWAGVTERMAQQRGLDVEVNTFPWAASGRSLAMGSGVGKTKMICDRETKRILGVGIAGTNAGDMIPEAVLAIEMGAVAEDVALSVHPHPTLSETFMEVAEMFSGTPTHIYRPVRGK